MGSVTCVNFEPEATEKLVQQKKIWLENPRPSDNRCEVSTLLSSFHVGHDPTRLYFLNKAVMLVNLIKRLFIVRVFRKNSIRARMIILPLSIVLHYFLTKTSDLTFIGCHNVRLQFCSMVVTTSVRAPSRHDDVHTCALMRFVPYPIPVKNRPDLFNST